MKKKYIPLLSFIIFIIIMISSCKVILQEPYAEIEDVVYTSSAKEVTFNVTIKDQDSVGSNFKINLYNQTTSKDVNTLDITSYETTQYKFSNLEADSDYMLYVTADYSKKTHKIKSTITFNTTVNKESYLEKLGISFENQTTQYDGSIHKIYATQNGSAILNTYTYNDLWSDVSYTVTYDSANPVAIEPGEYTFKINLYKGRNALFYKPTLDDLIETKEATLIITKGKKLYDFENETYMYSGKNYQVPFEFEGLTYSAINESGQKVEISDIVVPGIYTISYNFDGNKDYEAMNGKYTVTIEKAKITSTLKSQASVLTDGKAYLSVDSGDFSVNLNQNDYSITYYNSNNEALDTDYVTEIGNYNAHIIVPGNDYYNDFEIIVPFVVYDENNNGESPILISNVASFSVDTSNYPSSTYYFEYVQIYNNTNNDIDLSKVELTVDDNKVSLTGTLAANTNHTVMLYSTSKLIVFGQLLHSYHDMSVYANTYKKIENISGIKTISLKYSNNVLTYTKGNLFDDFTDSLYKTLNGEYKYKSSQYETLSGIIHAVATFDYTNIAPTISFNFNGSTISESRKELLLSNVTALDGLGNSIEISNDMVDLSEISTDNINQYINVKYSVYDDYGNITSYIKKFLLVDEEAPSIEISTKSTQVDLNKEIDYTSYFSVIDAADGNILVTDSMIDDSKLDITVPGIYPVTINVSDKAGNKASATIYFRVGIKNSYASDYLTKETIKSNLCGESYAMPSTGNVKVLVLPLKYDKATSEQNTSINNIRMAFNGLSTSKNVESVASYYREASYNKLNLTFEVYNSWIDVSDLDYDSYDMITKAMLKAFSTASKNYNLSDYDLDSDGYVDAVWFIYDINYSTNDNTNFWAWTSSINQTNTYQGLRIGKVCFASYEFMNSEDRYYQGYAEYGTNSITARTYIHETGHLLGLSDYYDYDKSSSVGQHHAMYGVDLMDSNYGDFDAASKFLLGWIDPIIVSNDDLVTIGSTALDSKNAILISKNFYKNKTIFSKYILLEFWTSDGLNKFDASNTFGTNNYGVRVLYLDAQINYVNGKPTLTSGTRSTYFKYNNTDDDSKNFLQTLAKNPDQIYNPLTGKYNTESNVLFDDSNIVFGKDVYENFTYNNGDALDFKFNIVSINSTSVTINISFN